MYADREEDHITEQDQSLANNLTTEEDSNDLLKGAKFDSYNLLEKVDEILNEPIQKSIRDFGMLTKAHLRFNAGIKATIGSTSTAIVGAAGAGFSDFHSTINANKALFISFYPELQKSLSNALEYYNALRAKGRDFLGQSSQKYCYDKVTKGCISYGFLKDPNQVAIGIALELASCGADDLKLDYSSDIPKITYTLPATNGRSKHEVYFLNKDVTTITSDDISQVFPNKVDVYYQRAAMSIPENYHTNNYFLSVLFNKISLGGNFVTDDIAMINSPQTVKDYRLISYDNCSEYFPEEFAELPGALKLRYEHISERKLFSALLPKGQDRSYTPRDFYGWYMYLRQKVKDVGS